ncbi:MAG: sterol desaturase family protein [Pseudomonadales bacterium]
MPEKLIFPIVISAALFSCWAGFALFGWSHLLASSVSILLFGFLTIPLLERLMPYREDWLQADDDTATDVVHLLVNNGLVTTLEKIALIAILLSLTAWLGERFDGSLWPHQWPLLVQLFLMLLLAEFGRYWVHRAAHKVPVLWRLHAVHHSPNRLYFLNAGRFHPLEKLVFQLPEVVPFILLGTGIETITLYLTFNSIHGLFQHSNIRLKLGWLNYVFSMTELHRWHHSRDPAESDRNFGNNLIVWDLVFGTYFNPPGREVGVIGVQNPAYPKAYLAQLLAPFRAQDVSQEPKSTKS